MAQELTTELAAEAIFSLYEFYPAIEPSPAFSIGGSCSYDDLVWYDTNYDKPTREQYEAAVQTVLENASPA